MSLFGKLFDFNRDGQAEFGEELFGIGLIGALTATSEEEAAQTRAAQAEEEMNEDTQDEIDALQLKRDGLAEKLETLQTKEPENPFGTAYDRWEERCYDLESEIEDLDSEISDLKDLLGE